MDVQPSIIIPACGSGARFGTDLPKHLFDVGGAPMVQRVIDELPSNVAIHLLVKPQHEAMTKALIRGVNVKITPVVAHGRGVCETLLAAPVNPRSKTLVVNCDNVIVPGMGWRMFLDRYDNAIITFWEDNVTPQPPPYSYCRVTKGLVRAVTEKKRLSRYACAGAFLFQDYETLRLLCNWHMAYDAPDVEREYYLAPAYSRLIDDPTTQVRCVHLTKEDTFIRMGTPLEALEAVRHYVPGNQR